MTEHHASDAHRDGGKKRDWIVPQRRHDGFRSPLCVFDGVDVALVIAHDAVIRHRRRLHRHRNYSCTHTRVCGVTCHRHTATFVAFLQQRSAKPSPSASKLRVGARADIDNVNHHRASRNVERFGDVDFKRARERIIVARVEPDVGRKTG